VIIDMAEVIPRNSLKTTLKIFRQYIIISLDADVTVLEVFLNEDSQFLGVMIIMDMVVLMADGSIANIEIQKISYDFPAERISCYSADLVLRQYKMITGKNADSMNGSSRPSYKDIRKVHTIILFEDSNKSLISDMDKALSMFSEALRILDRNTAELMVDRMKDEMDKLRVLSEEKDAEIEALKKRSEASDKLSAEKDAEIARLKRQLKEQNK